MVLHIRYQYLHVVLFLVCGFKEFSGPGMLGSDAICQRLEAANVFNVAKRNVEGQDMLYNSFKLSNGIW